MEADSVQRQLWWAMSSAVSLRIFDYRDVCFLQSPPLQRGFHSSWPPQFVIGFNLQDTSRARGRER
jgi:hypothetical protein